MTISSKLLEQQGTTTNTFGFANNSNSTLEIVQSLTNAVSKAIDKSDPNWWFQLDDNGRAVYFPSEEIIGESVFNFTIKHYLRTIPTCLKIYVPIHVIPSIFRWKSIAKNPKDSIKRIAKNIIKSVLFLSAFQGIFIVVILALRRAFKVDHPFNAAVAGASSAMSVLFEKKSRRAELMLYCVPRALEGLFKFGKRRDWWQGIENGQVILFSIAMALMTYFYRYESSAIKPTYLSLIHKLFA
eukprot:gb/GECH01000971.1/.p1 GENE.gb/GECH01000971.1/~~gb/GECH01000971.1/.p1  ORF type:complete len:241 (+),score=55.05 gb/GECH01000971.1/:1-723(+)